MGAQRKSKMREGVAPLPFCVKVFSPAVVPHVRSQISHFFGWMNKEVDTSATTDPYYLSQKNQANEFLRQIKALLPPAEEGMDWHKIYEFLLSLSEETEFQKRFDELRALEKEIVELLVEHLFWSAQRKQLGAHLQQADK